MPVRRDLSPGVGVDSTMKNSSGEKCVRTARTVVSVLAALAALVAIAPVAQALITVTGGSGETSITSSSVACGPMGAPNPGGTYHHAGSETARVPMDAGWHDSRPGSSPARTNEYKIDALYGGQHYINTYDHVSYGNDEDQHSFYVDVPSVTTGTISVTFSAAVYDSSSNNLCPPYGLPATISTTYVFAIP